VIYSMESRLSSFSGTLSKTRRNGERLNIFHFALDPLSCKSRILVGAWVNDGERLNICHFAPDLLSYKGRILVGAPKG